MSTKTLYICSIILNFFLKKLSLLKKINNAKMKDKSYILRRLNDK